MKVFIFSHDADIDGMGSVVLGKLAFDECDFDLVNYKNVDDNIISEINYGNLDDYDLIFITDVCPKDSTLGLIDHLEMKNRTVVLDHHDTSLAYNDKYDFCHNQKVKNGTLTSGTTLFYDYLKENGFLPPSLQSQAVSDFCELTRLSDTWEWHKQGVVMADDLAELFTIDGQIKYIVEMANKLKNNEQFAFTQNESQRISQRRQYLQSVYDAAHDTMHIEECDGTRVAVCKIPYEFVNNFSQYLRDLKTPAEILAIPAFERGTMSYRTLQDDSVEADKRVSVCDFAKKFGGGGSLSAAGSPISPEVKKALNIVDELESDDEKK